MAQLVDAIGLARETLGTIQVKCSNYLGLLC